MIVPKPASNGEERVLGGDLTVLLLPTPGETEQEDAAGSGANVCRKSNLKHRINKSQACELKVAEREPPLKKNKKRE